MTKEHIAKLLSDGVFPGYTGRPDLERENELNRRLTHDMYLDVQPIREIAGRFFVGGQVVLSSTMP